MTNNTEDLNLISGYINGDKECLVKIVEKYKDKIFNFCCGKLKNWHEAEDAAQNVFLNAPKYVENFKSESQFSTYLFWIARYKCCDIIDAKVKERKHVVKSTNDALVTKKGEKVSAEYPSDNLTPLEELIMKEEDEMFDRAIKKAVLSLSDEHREIYTLIDVEEKSYKQASLILKIKLGTVKSRLSIARSILKEKLKNEGVSL